MMSKYAKTALVLLYLLQLSVVFREQLEHLYESALESVHKRMDAGAHGQDAHEAPAEVLACMDAPPKMFPHPALRVIAALSIAIPPLPLTVDGGEKGDHPHVNHHDEDKHKDRLRKHHHHRRHPYLIRDLWPSIQAFVATLQRAERANEVSRYLTFA